MRMQIRQIQDLKDEQVKLNWRLVDDGMKTTTFHESDWVLLDRGFEVVGCFPNRVKAEEAMIAFTVVERAKLIIEYLDMVSVPTATESRTKSILVQALKGQVK